MTTTLDLEARLAALKLTDMFDIDRDDDAGTVVVTHLGPKRVEVLRAIAKSATGPWICRQVENLFDKE